MNDYFTSRHSVRSFASEEVSDALLKEIVDCAVHAPTTGNMQLYSVVAVRDEEKRKELAALHFNQPAASGAPVLLTVCADLHKFTRWCEVSDADAGFDNFQGLMYAFLDAVIFAQQLVTVAEQSGLGTCYLGTVTFNAEKIASLLNLPPMVIPVAALAVGYPSDEAPVETERIGSEGILHFERYPDLSDSDIADIYAVKDNFPANSGYVKEHSKRNLAQVFTDVRYPRGMNEEFSAPFVAFIRKQGFKF